MKREVMSMAFVLLLFLMMFSSLPLVSAAYTVDWPYMPPDLEGDANVNGHVDLFDAVIVASHYGVKLATTFIVPYFVKI